MNDIAELPDSTHDCAVGAGTTLQFAAGLPAMPAKILAKGKPRREWTVDGYTWRITATPHVRKLITVNLAQLDAVLDPETGTPVMGKRMRAIARWYLATRSPEWSPGHLRSAFWAILRLVRWVAAHPAYRTAGTPLEWSHVDGAMVTAWSAAEHRTRSRGRNVIYLRAMYDFCCDPEHGMPDFDPQVLAGWFFDRPRRSRVTRARGEDPRTGPIDRTELDALYHALLTGSAADPRDRAVVWLLIDSAGRPNEIAALRNRDLIVDRIAAGLAVDAPALPSYHLAKLNSKRDAPGEQRATRPIHRRLGVLLEMLRGEHQPRRKGRGKWVASQPSLSPDAPLLWWLGAKYDDGIKDALRRFVAAENIRSHRLLLEEPDEDGNARELLPLFPYRLRHGVAADRFNRGASLASVQALLGHSTPEVTRSNYMENSPRDALLFQETSDWAVVPLVRRLRGQTESPAAPVDAPEIPGHIPHLQSGRSLRVIGPIGKCGRGSVCEKSPVISCFTCRDYVARPDRVDTIREVHAQFVEFLTTGPGAGAAEVVRQQLRHAITGMEEWISHLEDAKAAAFAEAGGAR